MRTTVNLAKDVAAAVEKLGREEGLGVSEALNRIARAGISTMRARRAFRQRSANMGPFAVDVSGVGEALEKAEGVRHR